MAFCISCGQELADGAKFCANCGKAVDSSNSTTQRKTVYDGEIHKCPQCGDVLDAYEAICQTCGYEVRGPISSSVVADFAEKISKLKSNEERENLIRNFYIPNTKEDIMEFFILATSNFQNDLECQEAWLSKLEQTYQKAKLSFSNTTEFNYLQQIYNKSVKQKKWKKTTKMIVKSQFLQAVLCTAVGGVLFYIGILLDGTETAVIFGLLALIFLGIGFLLFFYWVLKHTQDISK